MISYLSKLVAQMTVLSHSLKPREVEVGILCYPDRDLLPDKPAAKLLAMLQDAGVNAKINQPYSLVLGTDLLSSALSAHLACSVARAQSMNQVAVLYSLSRRWFALQNSCTTA